MRTITRTGVTLSVVAALALYGLQLIAGLVAPLGVIVVGVAAGLSMAKWLPRDWYGRQLEAGARAGAIACGVAGLSATIYLIGQGGASVEALAARSHLLGVSMAPLALALSPIGVVGVAIVSSLVATLLGVAAAALTAQVFGWGKDKRSQRVIAQARLAAQSHQQGELGAQTTATGARPASPSVALYGRADPMSATNGPVSSTDRPAARRTAGPLPDMDTGEAPLTFDSWGDEATTVRRTPAGQGGAAPKSYGASNARSTDDAISAEQRAALQAWEETLARESEPGATPDATREPKASEFLNQPTVAPKRNRRKQNTRDWLC